MGAGKSTIGRLLSDELGLPFIDSDKEIEDRSGANIPWIFDLEGEAGFRERESQVIDDLTGPPAKVLATGGGAILSESNRRVLSGSGYVVYLKTSVEQQLIRTAKDRNRPLLQRDDPEAVLRSLARQRNGLYESTAHLTVDTNGLSPKAVVREIISHFEQA